jgi:hypothetical protein
MEELSDWFEVIRSLLPTSFEMRIVWEKQAIVVAYPMTERAMVLTRTSLRGKQPTRVVDFLRAELDSPRLGTPQLVA